jgi:outer membrane immunogenic protein
MRIIIAAAAAILTSTAYAADLVEPAPIAPPPIVASNPFNGFYAGIHGGYGWANASGNGTLSYAGIPEEQSEEAFAIVKAIPVLGSFPFDSDQDGWLFGGQLGYNWVGSSGLLIGGEISGSWANIKGSYYAPGISAETTWDAIGIAQAKLGWANDRIALYVSGGGALGHSDTSFSTPIGYMKFDDTHGGWTVGAGADVMVWKDVSLGLSYNYIDFGSSSGYGMGIRGTSFNYNADSDMHLIKLNLNYHF